MEQYLQLAILLFPGYAAKEIACYLGDIGKRQKSSLEEYSLLPCVNPTVLDPCSDEARKVLD